MWIIAYKPISTSQLPPNKLNGFLQLNNIIEFLLFFFLGGKPMWIHSTAILSASILASLGVIVHERLTKQAFEN